MGTDGQTDQGVFWDARPVSSVCACVRACKQARQNNFLVVVTPQPPIHLSFVLSQRILCLTRNVLGYSWIFRRYPSSQACLGKHNFNRVRTPNKKNVTMSNIGGWGGYHNREIVLPCLLACTHARTHSTIRSIWLCQFVRSVRLSARSLFVFFVFS